MIGAAIGSRPTKFIALLGLLSCCGTGAARACPCDPISPSAGFDRAQYVFTGKIVTADAHAWVVDVDRVWKGKLASTIKLMDIYGSIDCEFFFEQGKSYLIYAIIAKGGRQVFYHPQVCNWTRPLQSTRVRSRENETVWVEELVAREHGPGERPSAESH